MEVLAHVAMTGVKGTGSHPRCNQLPSMQMDAQPEAQLQIR